MVSCLMSLRLGGPWLRDQFLHANTNMCTSFPEYYVHRIPRSREVQQSWLSSVLTTLYSMWLSFPLTYRVKPDLNRIEKCVGICILFSLPNSCSKHNIVNQLYPSKNFKN
ncbi:hypothetical protein FD755_002117 [Muntiacus reevesi]|uniref:UDP-N-acetylglucosamine transferase subunit ALG14 n=1 Tax=Muntiacus reevesi TaxID=9886 RepID=A0A5J5N3A7_MUNRE|nr:hypothetical protein FD755_002117 [Muntiacus reevesi]